MGLQEYVKNLEDLNKIYRETCEDYRKICKKDINNRITIFLALIVSIMINVFLIVKYTF